MTVALNRYALRPMRSPQEWAAYYAIRRQTIFAALLPGQAYDEHDPDEIALGNFPHVLLRDGVTPDRCRQPSFAWEGIAVITASRRSPTEGASSATVSLPSQMPQIVPNPRH
jgi:hypothetical protein